MQAKVSPQLLLLAAEVPKQLMASGVPRPDDVLVPCGELPMQVPRGAPPVTMTATSCGHDVKSRAT